MELVWPDVSVLDTTDLENIASQRVIEANGGVLVERFHKHDVLEVPDGLRYRIGLSPP